MKTITIKFTAGFPAARKILALMATELRDQLDVREVKFEGDPEADPLQLQAADEAELLQLATGKLTEHLDAPGTVTITRD